MYVFSYYFFSSAFSSSSSFSSSFAFSFTSFSSFVVFLLGEKGDTKTVRRHISVFSYITFPEVSCSD